MVTSDFILPVSTLNLFPGDPVLRGAIRVWDLKERKIVRTIQIPSALGTMDVKLIPGDPQGRAFTAGIVCSLVCLVEHHTGTPQHRFLVAKNLPHPSVA